VAVLLRVMEERRETHLKWWYSVDGHCCLCFSNVDMVSFIHRVSFTYGICRSRGSRSFEIKADLGGIYIMLGVSN
jgi:hypothetical protein